MVNIVIVEDDTITRQSLEEYLDSMAGFHVVSSYGNAEDALHALRTNAVDHPDLMLLDIGLPGMTGLEALPSFREVNDKIDIVMFTTYDEEEKVFAALCAGACSYISKRTSLKVIGESLRVISQGGSYMSPNIARIVANHFHPKQTTPSTKISDRQMEIVKCLVNGLSYKMIAEELNISIDTVRTHIKRIYKALQVRSSLEVVNLFNAGKLI